jgi:hypothetical protein
MPNMRCCFDSDRPLTTFEHLVADDADQGNASRQGHFLEWAKLVAKLDGEEAATHARLNMERRYSIHFHVWDGNSWLDFLNRGRDYLGRAFEIRHFELSGPEILTVLYRS